MKVFTAALAVSLLIHVARIGGQHTVQIGRNMTPCWEDAVFCYGEATGCKGLINSKGELIHEFPIELESVGGFYEGLMEAGYLDEGVGFVDTRGRWAIKPRFEMGKRFSGGLAPARMDRKWGYIDREGGWVIEPKFAEVEPFSADGYARAYVGSRGQKDRRVGFIDREGKWVIEPKLYEAKDLRQGVAWVITNGPCWTDWPFGPGMNPFWYVYGGGREGHRQEPPHPKDGGVPACTWRLIDKDGRLVSEREFDEVTEYSAGLAAAKSNGAWGYVDARGAWAIAPVYASARPFSEGLAAVKTAASGPTLFIDRAGKVVIGDLPWAGDFQDGVAVTGTDGPGRRRRFIDRTGAVILDDVAGRPSSFCNGLSSVLLSDYPLEAPYETSYIDRTGRTVFQWKWTLYP